MSEHPFRLKVRIGDMEIEIGGKRVEVLETLDDLEMIVEKFSEAFNKDVIKITESEGDLPRGIKKFPNIPMFVISHVPVDYDGEKKEIVVEKRNGVSLIK